CDSDEVRVRQRRQVGETIEPSVKALQHAGVPHRVQGTRMHTLVESFARPQHSATISEDPASCVNSLVSCFGSHWIKIPAFTDKCWSYYPQIRAWNLRGTAVHSPESYCK